MMARSVARLYRRLRYGGGSVPYRGWTTRAREDVLWLGFNYVGCSGLTGDYAEFGVWRSGVFTTAYYWSKELGALFPSFRSMRFHAFDSFEGFPEPKGSDVWPAIQKGGRACSQEMFEASLRRHAVSRERITITKGWFSETLAPGATGDCTVADGSLALAFVDCDLYESTRDVLTYLRRKLQPGALLLFDDWYLFAGHPLRGEQRACREWLSAFPEIVLVPFQRFGWHGHSFLFHVLTPKEQERLAVGDRAHHDELSVLQGAKAHG